jgi:Carboxypeptidase regulatory-like domain
MMAQTRWLLGLFIACACLLPAAESFVLGGVIVDSLSHRPLPNARVLLALTSSRAEKLEQVTKQDGRFSFTVKQPGKYGLQMTKAGYTAQAYRRSGIGGLSSAIVVRNDQDTGHIVFEANRGAAIVGVIKDENSEPAGGAVVSVFQSSVVGGERKIVPRGQTTANAIGEFRMAGFQPGNYYVSASGRPWFSYSLAALEMMQESMEQNRARFRSAPRNAVPTPQSAIEPNDDVPPEPPAPQFSPDPDLRGTAYLTMFYPRAPSIEQASMVRLEAGNETQISITLPLAKTVTVKGSITLSGETGGGRIQLFQKLSDQYVLFLEDQVGPDATFQLKNIPSGSYLIVVSGASGWIVRQDLAIGSSDIELTLRPQALGAFAGRVLFEGERPASTTNLSVSLRDEQGHLFRIPVDPEGAFSLSRILPGRYEVAAGSADYIATHLSGPNGEHLPLILEVTPGESVHNDLALTKAAAAIEGTVEKAGVPSVGAFVLLMPKNPAQRWAYRVDQTDSDGSYSLASIPFGDYYLIALSDGADIVYRDAKVAAKLISAAKPVHIEPGDHLEMKLEIVGTATVHLPPL